CGCRWSAAASGSSVFLSLLPGGRCRPQARRPTFQSHEAPVPERSGRKRAWFRALVRLVQLPDDARRRPRRQRSRWHIPGDHAAGPDDRARAYRHALQDDHARTQPAVGPDGNGGGTAVDAAALLAVVIAVHDQRVLADQGALTDPDFGMRRDRAAVVQKRAIANPQQAAGVGVELAADGVSVNQDPVPDLYPAPVADEAVAVEARAAADQVASTQVISSTRDGQSAAERPAWIPQRPVPGRGGRQGGYGGGPLQGRFHAHNRAGGGGTRNGLDGHARGWSPASQAGSDGCSSTRSYSPPAAIVISQRRSVA